MGACGAWCAPNGGYSSGAPDFARAAPQHTGSKTVAKQWGVQTQRTLRLDEGIAELRSRRVV